MLTLTYGRKKPEEGDVGDPIFTALEDNIELDDAHTHNGSDSSKLTTSSITRTTQAIAAGNWAAVGDGTGRYSQTIAITGGVLFDTIGYMFTNDADDSIIYPDVIKNGASGYDIYVNDNTLALTAVYL